MIIPIQCQSTKIENDISIAEIAKDVIVDSIEPLKYSITFDKETSFTQGEYPLIINGITTDKTITISNTVKIKRY